MRLAVISDIHSNLPALEAVLEAIDRSDLQTIWCLGDVVGYGATPDDCAKLVAERCQICLAGNHDLAVLGDIEASAFAPAAADAVGWTRQHCRQETIDFLRSLSPVDEREGVGLYHASPRDPVWEYVLAIDDAAECLAAQKQRVCLIGHSHVALHFSTADAEPRDNPDYDGVAGQAATAGTRLELTTGRWLVNPGSVGQPRDGDPRAAWLELDTAAWSGIFHRVEYDVDRAAEAIVDGGLPQRLAERLYAGQ